MSKAAYDDLSTRDALLTHELSHVRQKHSWDILFIETLQIFCWLNPTFYFYKKAIQLTMNYWPMRQLFTHMATFAVTSITCSIRFNNKA